MLRHRTIIMMTLLAVALGALLAGRTFASNRIATVPAGGKIWGRVAQKLELTTNQQTQIKALFLSEKDCPTGKTCRPGTASG